MFWGPATLIRRIEAEELIEPFDPNLVGRANYILSVGDEAYVTPTASSVKAEDRDVKDLDALSGVVIPSGQFGFILTKEIVKVPDDAIAFISMRVRYKNRGLVNVSGFHVDPGWKGKLIFAVFNAGPTDITIHKNDPYFHIWFADIDSKVVGTPSSWDNKIGSDLINNIGQPIISLKVLQDRLHKLEAKQNLVRLVMTGILAFLAPLAAGFGAGLAVTYFNNNSISAKSSNSEPVYQPSAVLEEPHSSENTQNDEVVVEGPEKP